MNETLKEALKCCAEFLCEYCPYERYESKEYPMRCIHKLVYDVYAEVKENTDGPA